MISWCTSCCACDKSACPAVHRHCRQPLCRRLCSSNRPKECAVTAGSPRCTYVCTPCFPASPTTHAPVLCCAGRRCSLLAWQKRSAVPCNSIMQQQQPACSLMQQPACPHSFRSCQQQRGGTSRLLCWRQGGTGASSRAPCMPLWRGQAGAWLGGTGVRLQCGKHTCNCDDRHACGNGCSCSAPSGCCLNCMPCVLVTCLCYGSC